MHTTPQLVGPGPGPGPGPGRTQPLGPLEQLRAGRLAVRIPLLVAGLLLYGAALALIIRAGLGTAPWDVLHLGLTRWLPVSIGTMVVIVSFVVLLLWIPLREMPGLGTVANSLLIGPAADLTLMALPEVEGLAVRVPMVIAGVVLNGLATAMYIGAQLGPGPRDGLMTGIARRSGRSIRSVRTAIEIVVVASGWLLGGVVGLGTVLYVLLIGPVAQAALPWCTVRLEPRAAPDPTD
ncbi:Uncharacterized membrane protein YczE [Kytococcus aerolatus]|uniref:Uncharacterized membrane protein YczE n=1 Tax=Kytococcus aerolatus TaxID=592308 RepID=A0A212TB99_9MICO|nr:hypothetical protein [Kytococcus aerolatus]SNC63106.1 Uncharacterized membrane protein YczE [Kytococcus aerolatus]